MPAGTLDKGEKSNPQRGGYNPDPVKPSEEHPRRKPVKVDPKNSPYEPDEVEKSAQIRVSPAPRRQRRRANRAARRRRHAVHRGGRGFRLRRHGVGGLSHRRAAPAARPAQSSGTQDESRCLLVKPGELKDVPPYGAAPEATWRWLSKHAKTRAKRKVIDLGCQGWDEIRDSVPDEAYSARPEPVTLLEPHLRMLARTSPRPFVEPDIGLLIGRR